MKTIDPPSWLTFFVCVSAALVPIFLLAGKVDGDEFAKSGLGLATVGAIVTITKLYNRKK